MWLIMRIKVCSSLCKRLCNAVSVIVALSYLAGEKHKSSLTLD